MVKDGRQHIDSLRDGRRIFIDGACVDDHTEHPAFRNAIRSGRRPLRLPGAAAESGENDVRLADVGRSRQPDVAAADVARRTRRAPSGARSLGGAHLRHARALTRSRRVLHLRDVHGPGSLRAAQRRPGRRRSATTTSTRATTTSISPTSSSARRPTAARAPASSRTSSWSPACATRTARASRSAARRCSAPDARWPTKCSSARSSR